MANQKIKLISFLCIILILGFLTINIVNYLISVSLVRKQIVTQSLPLTTDNIYFKIQKELQKPIGIASSMAKNSFLIEWILKGEKEKTEISKYLEKIMHEYNIFNQKVASKILAKVGCKVDVASNGKEALKALDNFPYNLILMDIQMPVMDGYESTSKIRERTDLISKIPIIAMTANAMQGDKEKCIDAGMNDYISKPVSKKAIWNMLQKYKREKITL